LYNFVLSDISITLQVQVGALISFNNKKGLDVKSHVEFLNRVDCGLLNHDS